MSHKEATLTTVGGAEGLSAQLHAVYLRVCEHEAHRRGARGMRTFTQLLRVYLRWLDENELHPSEVRVADAEAYRSACASTITGVGTPYSHGSVRNLLKAASCLHRSLMSLRECTTNPYASLDRLKRREGVIKNVLNEVQMQRLLQYLGDVVRTAPTLHERCAAFRVHVLAELLYASGLRIAEAAGIEVQDLQCDEQRLWVRSGKDQRPRMAYLTLECVALLGLWLTHGRPLMIKQGDPRLFGAVHENLGRALNPALQRATHALQLPPITSHCFRHSLGYHLLRGGADVRYIQAILGHERIDSTQIYTRVDKEDLRTVLDAHHPRGHLHGGMVGAASPAKEEAHG